MRSTQEEDYIQPPLCALLVEDEEIWLNPMMRILTKSGLVVTIARSAPEAMRLAVDRSYDIALIDYVLGPGESGFEVARAVRHASPNAVIIILTGWPNLPANPALDVKIDDLVLKSSLSLQLLHDRIADAARRRQLDSVALSVAYLDTVVSDNLSTIAHELRSPIVSIELQAESLFAGALGPLSQSQRAAMDLIITEARRGLNLVNGHLELIRIAGGASLPSDASVDVALFLTEEVAYWTAIAQAKDVRLSLRAPASYPASIDANILRAGLNPLVENAIKFSPAGGIVSLSLERADGYLKIVVADDGPGMHVEDIENLMGRHDTARPARLSTRARGTGLGLTIARRAAELNGGGLKVLPSDNGTTIALLLREHRNEAANR